RHIAGVNGQPQDFIERGSPETQRKRYFLTLFRSPARAVHQPEEVRLNPRHATKAELASETLMLNGVMADSRSIRLVNHDGIAIELGEDVPSGSGPTRQLIQITLYAKVHALLSVYSATTSINP